MTLKSQFELVNTRTKLQWLEERYETTRCEQGGNARVKALTMISLKRLINQLKEEIIRFEVQTRSHKLESHEGVGPQPTDSLGASCADSEA